MRAVFEGSQITLQGGHRKPGPAEWEGQSQARPGGQELVEGYKSAGVFCAGWVRCWVTVRLSEGGARQFQLLAFFHGVPFLLRGQRIWRSVVGRPWGRFHVPGLMFLGPGTGCLPMPPMGAADMFLGAPSDLVSSLL